MFRRTPTLPRRSSCRGERDLVPVGDVSVKPRRPGERVGQILSNPARELRRRRAVPVRLDSRRQHGADADEIEDQDQSNQPAHQWAPFRFLAPLQRIDDAPSSVAYPGPAQRATKLPSTPLAPRLRRARRSRDTGSALTRASSSPRKARNRRTSSSGVAFRPGSRVGRRRRDGLQLRRAGPFASSGARRTAFEKRAHERRGARDRERGNQARKRSPIPIDAFGASRTKKELFLAKSQVLCDPQRLTAMAAPETGA